MDIHAIIKHIFGILLSLITCLSYGQDASYWVDKIDQELHQDTMHKEYLYESMKRYNIPRSRRLCLDHELDSTS